MFESSSLCINPLVTVLSATIAIGKTGTFMFHSFFQFFSKGCVLISLFAFLMISRNSKVHCSVGFVFFSFFFFFLLPITRTGRLAEFK